MQTDVVVDDDQGGPPASDAVVRWGTPLIFTPAEIIRFAPKSLPLAPKSQGLPPPPHFEFLQQHPILLLGVFPQRLANLALF